MDDSPHTADSISDRDRVQAGFRYALALTHHREEAEDLVQEAWMNLCRRYGGVGSNALLCTAVRNLFVDQCRRRKIVQFESLDAPDPAPLPAAPGEEPGLQGDVETLMATLRADEREVLFLHYYEGRTAEEIGRLTNRPRGTILSLLHRTVAKLRANAAAAPRPAGCNHLLLLFVHWM